GNRRYYQHHEVLLIRSIRHLLYEEGFTISGARSRLNQTGLNGLEMEGKVAMANIDPATLRHELNEILLLLRA
ncbi:MAG: MerR family transcriptional regulator, partial [Gallionellales bacterium CG_4_9_14_0_8_um_filter_59_50]